MCIPFTLPTNTIWFTQLVWLWIVARLENIKETTCATLATILTAIIGRESNQHHQSDQSHFNQQNILLCVPCASDSCSRLLRPQESHDTQIDAPTVAPTAVPAKQFDMLPSRSIGRT